MATSASILAWRIPWIEEPGRLSPQGCTESDMTKANEQTHIHTLKAGKSGNSNTLATSFEELTHWKRP